MGVFVAKIQPTKISIFRSIFSPLNQNAGIFPVIARWFNNHLIIRIHASNRSIYSNDKLIRNRSRARRIGYISRLIIYRGYGSFHIRYATNVQRCVDCYLATNIESPPHRQTIRNIYRTCV